MSPESFDLGRLLREGRATLAVPDETTTERARERALGAIRRRRPRGRVLGVVVLAIVFTLALGVGLGVLVTPSGSAASGSVGTGFLPAPGWTVLQTGADASPDRQALAIAANVPPEPEDDARGIRASSGLPYATLLRLPESGVVIVALFTVREPYAWQDEEFPRRKLPLRVRDALQSISYSTQVRPERPLGQYELRARVNGHYVDLQFYFGTARPSQALVAKAQRQLDRLVVASASASEAVRIPAAASATPSASRVIDRTVVCTISDGSPREILVSAESGTRLFGDASKWKNLPNAGFYDRRSTNPQLTGRITAGWPPIRAGAGLPLRTDMLSYSARCLPSSARVPLSTSGLSGGAAGPFGDRYDCVVARRVLVRIRGVFYKPTSLRRQRPTRYVDQLAANGRVREGALAVRTESGKPIAFATVHESGRARLFVGPSCGPSG